VLARGRGGDVLGAAPGPGASTVSARWAAADPQGLSVKTGTPSSWQTKTARWRGGPATGAGSWAVPSPPAAVDSPTEAVAADGPAGSAAIRRASRKASSPAARRLVASGRRIVRRAGRRGPRGTG
jgi:hypothetical protein